MDPFPPLGRTMEIGRRQCSYSPGDTPAHDCGEVATRHILWHPNGDNGLACDPHMAVARSHFVFADSHPVGPDCGMPGTEWSFDEKRCICSGEPATLVAACTASQPKGQP